MRAVILHLCAVALSVANICTDLEDCLGRANLHLSATTLEERSLALPLYQAAIEFDPSCKDAWLGLGGCQKELGQLPDALHSFSIAFSLDPLCWRVGLNIASILAIQTDFNASVRTYKHVIRTHPYHPQAYYSIGFIRLHQVPRPFWLLHISARFAC
jgi:tetratricopeptide (TPR) repeat protein